MACPTYLAWDERLSGQALTTEIWERVWMAENRRGKWRKAPVGEVARQVKAAAPTPALRSSAACTTKRLEEPGNSCLSAPSNRHAYWTTS